MHTHTCDEHMRAHVCMQVGGEEDPDAVAPLTLGRVSSYYYLKYTSVALFNAELHDVDEAPALCICMCVCVHIYMCGCLSLSLCL